MPAAAPPLDAPNTAPTHQRRKAERPHELLEAALALFAERGFAATRTDDVAQRAGVSKGTLYLYYPSKADLFKAVVQHFLGDEIARGAAQVAAFDGPTPELMRQVFTAWWLHVINSPVSGVFKLVISEMRNFPDLAEFYNRAVVEPGQQVILGMLRRGIERGEFRPIDVEVAVQSLMLPMVMLCVHKHSVGACLPCASMVAPEQFVQGHIELLLHGLQAPAG